MIEAVTAILVYEDELFIIKRQPHLRAFPGYHAFPGGKIDACDSGVDFTTTHPAVDNLPAEHLCALQRELLEELQFDLAVALEQSDVVSLSLFGEAVTPAFERIRFCAHYYKIVLRKRPDFILDRNEIAHGGWHRPGDLYQQYCQGKALMVVPMQNTLRQLARDSDIHQAQPFNIETPVDEIPCLELIHGFRYLPIRSNTLRPATHTNAPLLGDPGGRQVLVDPSPESDDVYQQLLLTLQRHPISAILISHHHPDHHQYAMQLARTLALPVMMTEASKYWMARHFGADYLAEIELEMIAEGSHICDWKGLPVRAYELPGHDEGMVGLAPDSLRWFFIADLAQSQGSILIPEEGGDLALYMQSLRRVIGLQPDYILPSHGVLSGGTEILQRTLRHRQERHLQIQSLRGQQSTEADIVTTLYPDLATEYIDFARQTVAQHLHLIDSGKPL